jgi:hypothetical protein
MDPLQAWTLMAFLTLMSVALLLLELGMRRARRAPGKRFHADPPFRRGHGTR